MGDMGDTFRALKEHKKENYDNNSEKRIEYATNYFEKNNVNFELKNKDNGHFNLSINGKVVIQFWSWTGKIDCVKNRVLSTNLRGIKSCVKLYQKLGG